MSISGHEATFFKFRVRMSTKLTLWQYYRDSYYIDHNKRTTVPYVI